MLSKTGIVDRALAKFHRQSLALCTDDSQNITTHCSPVRHLGTACFSVADTISLTQSSAQCLKCFQISGLCNNRLGNKPYSTEEAVDQSGMVVWVQVDPVRRMFDILRKEDCRYVAPDDLKSMMAGILLSHPGLEFLQETPEFQDRYTCVAHV